ncbi:MAG: hypothetical protein FJW80_03125 [Actinobacteria bacterium]|nr:hypothetical protein [Actinomycetota bacterium]
MLIGLVFNFSNGVLLLSFGNLFQYAHDLQGLSLSLMQGPFLLAGIVAGFGLIIPAIPCGGLFLQEADPKHYGAVSTSRITVGPFWYALGLAGSTVLIDGLTRNAVSKRIRTSASGGYERSVMSREMPHSPTTLPAPSVRGALMVQETRSSPVSFTMSRS